MKDKFWLSHFNQEPDVLSQLDKLPKKVKIYDTTLRDGEQTVGVSFTKEEKLEIAKALAEAGVDRIEAGFPSSNESDKDAIQAIVDNVKNAEIWGFGRCNVNDIKANLETGVKHMVCEILTSPEKMKAWNLSEETVLKRIKEAITFAKEQGIYTSFFAVDATRSNPEFLKKAYQLAVNDCGADEVVVVDTLGVASPEAMGYLTRQVRSWVDVPMAIHTHNDFSLGVATTIAGLKEGADCAHVTVNGLGEKSGNADLSSLVLSLHGLYNVGTNIDIKRLYHLSRLVARLSRLPVSPMAPVVVERVFTRESGLVVAQMLAFPPSIEGYDPAVLGRERQIVLGKKSGRKSIEYALKNNQLDFPEELMQDLLDAVKEKGIRIKNHLTNEQFLSLVEELNTQ